MFWEFSFLFLFPAGSELARCSTGCMKRLCRETGLCGDFSVREDAAAVETAEEDSLRKEVALRP